MNFQWRQPAHFLETVENLSALAVEHIGHFVTRTWRHPACEHLQIKNPMPRKGPKKNILNSHSVELTRSPVHKVQSKDVPYLCPLWAFNGSSWVVWMKMAPRGSSIWTRGSQSVVLLGRRRRRGLSGGSASLWEGFGSTQPLPSAKFLSLARVCPEEEVWLPRGGIM